MSIEISWDLLLRAHLTMIHHRGQQAIIWSSADLMYWYVYASFDVDESNGIG